VIPVALFAYARPDYLRKTLACLRENQVPLIYAFSDGPPAPDKALQVDQVREILRVYNAYLVLKPIETLIRKRKK
jgi:hypothetical protein